MTADFNPDIIPIKDFDASKQMKLFQALKQNRFSGQLSFKNTQDIEWLFFLYMGRIIYATGGKHPVMRWRRNLAKYMPQIANQLQKEIKEVNWESVSEIWLIWDYHLLHLWVKQQKIDLKQVTKNIRGLTSEILFDITQANTVSFYLIPQKKLSFQPLAMIDAEQQITQTERFWQKWQELGFSEILPNLAPIIVNAQTLQETASEKTYQFFTKLLDGKHTIRDLAFQKQTNSLIFLRSIFPYIQLGDIKLLDIADIPCPITIPKTQTKHQSVAKITNARKLSIACVTISPIMSQIMTKVATVAGYNIISESDSLQAMPLLLDSKPDLIFLDTELTGLSGYEICTQLRQLNYFSKTPIILLARNITLIERMKSKMSGASELFQQSMDVKAVLNLVQKYGQLLADS
jgi:chemotaxis family two-component system response regulator PixG